MTSNRFFLLPAVWLLAASSAAAAADDPSPARAAPERPKLSYATSWLGNSFSGVTKIMQRSIYGFYVAADGTCYTNSGWDESGQDAGIYKDGDYVGRLPGIHDRATSGSRAVTGDDKYVFYAAHRRLKDEPNVRLWCIGRALLDARPAPWEGHNDNFLPVLKAEKAMAQEGAMGEIFGLAVHGDELFVTMGGPDQVLVYDKQSGRQNRRFVCSRPGAIVADRAGSLWIVQRSGQPGARLESEDSGLGFKIVQYSPEGKPLGREITDVGRPQALAQDAAGRLLVADDGARQQIVIYDVAGAQPKEAGTLGDRGGIWTGMAGLLGPRRLAYPCGVGTDAQGNFYVAARLPVTGCEIRKVTPDGQQQWQLYCNQFMNCADADPASDGARVFSPRECFVLDFNKSAGREARWTGHTVNKFKYPDDPRLHGEGSKGYAPLMRRLNGRLYMYLLGERGRIAILKEVQGTALFAPCGLYSTGPITRTYPEGWPAVQPAKGRWFWIDTNGDGRIDRDEIQADSVETDAGWSLWVDTRGGIWHSNQRTRLLCYPLQGIDAHGSPRYTLDSARRWDAPEPFPQTIPNDGLTHTINRIEYQIDSDTMFLAGFTGGPCPVTNRRGVVRVTAMGAELFCYERWSQTDRKLRWRIPILFNPHDQTACAQALSVAGNRVFVGAVGGGGTQNKIWVYDAATGHELGIITPGPEVGIFGWIDFTHGLRSFLRSNGETLLFVEDVWKEKQVLYRLQPDHSGSR